MIYSNFNKKNRGFPAGKGFALVVLLWILGGLSMFTMTMSSVVKKESNYLSAERSLVEGRALGEAAAYLLLTDFSNRPEKIPINFEVFSKTYKGTNFDISITPWTGLIDINAANQEVFLFLFEHLAGLSHAEAFELSNNVINSRENSKKQINALWENTDELLKVNKLNYFIYSRIKKYLVVSNEGNNSIYIGAAPPELSYLLKSFGNKEIYDETPKKSNFLRMIVHVKETHDHVDVYFDVNLNKTKKTPWNILKNDVHIKIPD